MVYELIFYYLFSHIFSFLCSIFEAVLLSCSPSYIEILKKKGKKSGEILEKLHSQIDRPLAAILTVNTISHTFGAAGVGACVQKIFGDQYVALGSVILTLTLLYWTEMFPKTIGALYWKQLAPYLARPIQILIIIAYPFVFSFGLFAKWLSKGREKDLKITEDDIRGALASGARAGVIKIEEQEMVENIFRLADRNVGVIMTPRVDLSFIDLKEAEEKNKDKIFHSPSDRFLVCSGGVDDVIGIVDVKEILKILWKDQKINWSSIVKPPHFVHENQRVLEFMEVLDTGQARLALVIDEYGVLQGAITFEEVLKAIVKDIDESGTSYFQQVNPRCWLLDGRMPIDEFKEIFNIPHLPDEDKARYRTLGGLCMMLTGAVPQKGDVILFDAYKIEILRAYKRRVEKLLLTRRSI
jgi:putative hemolysin